MTKEQMLALKQELTELKIEFAELTERVKTLEERSAGEGVYLEGVPKGYRDYIKELDKEV